MHSRWKLGPWRVDLRRGTLSRRRGWRTRTQHLDGRLLRVLEALLRQAGQTVSTDELLASAWPGRVVSKDSITTAIYQLRQLLGDDSERPVFIASEPRRGYRLVADVTPLSRPAIPSGAAASAAIVLSVVLGAVAMYPRDADLAGPILVEPLLDLTEAGFERELSAAIESTFLSELIRIAPGRVHTQPTKDSALILQSAIVQCDPGPALVLRLLDTHSDTFVWSQAYAMDEAAAAAPPPTLVQLMAKDVQRVLQSSDD